MRLYLLAALVLLVACAAHPATATNAPSVGMPSVAKLKISMAGKLTGHCTVWKADDRLLVTAGHCCDEDYTYGLDEGMSYPGSAATLLVDDDDHDICVLRGQMQGPRIALAGQDPDVGAFVWTAGYPDGVLLISSGYWSGRSQLSDGVWGTASAVGRHGASGSPMMDADGRAIGVLVAGYLDGGDNIEFTALLEWLRNDLALARLK